MDSLFHLLMDPTAPPMLTLTEAAQLTGLPPRRLLELSATGQLPGRQLGNSRQSWRSYQPALLHWLEQHGNSSA